MNNEKIFSGNLAKMERFEKQVNQQLGHIKRGLDKVPPPMNEDGYEAVMLEIDQQNTKQTVREQLKFGMSIFKRL